MVAMIFYQIIKFYQTIKFRLLFLILQLMTIKHYNDNVIDFINFTISHYCQHYYYFDSMNLYALVDFIYLTK